MEGLRRTESCVCAGAIPERTSGGVQKSMTRSGQRVYLTPHLRWLEW